VFTYVQPPVSARWEVWAVSRYVELRPPVCEYCGEFIEDEAREWTEHRLDPLSGYPYYKLRAGDYRAIITWDTALPSP
jgi:mRNA interferase RelE/StbE